MANAKEEFLRVTKRKTLKCATISQGDGYYWDEVKDGPKPDNSINLPVGFTKGEYLTFLEKINFNYDSGYGGQELFGTIWNNDGSWLERGEYDGSEWWDFHNYPEIPDYLQ